MSDDIPHHLNATAADLQGNDGIGRYVFLPGSDGRAARIAKAFGDYRVLPSPRRHDLHLGTLDLGDRTIDVAAVASGMGCPSLDIIVTELLGFGARRFLRIGTAGALQPWVSAGDVVVANAAVRDENTSRLYLPPEFPSVASPAIVAAAHRAADRLDLDGATVHTGLIHSKDSLHAREFGAGPLEPENRRYQQVLAAAGVLASEMESSHLFVLCGLHGATAEPGDPAARALAGSVLGILGHGVSHEQTEDRAIALGLETIREVARSEIAGS